MSFFFYIIKMKNGIDKANKCVIISTNISFVMEVLYDYNITYKKYWNNRRYLRRF